VRLRLLILLILAQPALSHAQEGMMGVTFLQFDNNGLLESRMQADSIDYTNQQILINHPRIWQNQWQISAKSATVNKGLKVISFKEDITILKSDDPTFSIKTSKLDYLIEQKVFINQERVRFNKNHVTITGNGIKANLVNNNIQVLNNIRTSIEIN
jgi:LPS export ABC transporter protein LptC